jgi:hypothetical protein
MAGKRNEEGESANLHPRTMADIAKLAHVSRRSLFYARRARRYGAPELIAAVEHGELAASTASELSYLSHEDQREALTHDWREIVATARAIRLVLRRRTAGGAN